MPDQFFQTPTTFAFNRSTVFYWTDGQGTLLTGLFVRGNTDPTEVKELPLNQTNCGTDASGACVQYVNNGTGTFGGPYADGLVLGHTYHFNIQWTEPDGSLTGNSSSSTFSMINPVVSSASKISTSSSTSTFIPASATSALATSTSASITATGAAETKSPASSTSSNSLSTGAKAGIAVAATLVGVLLLLLGIFFFCRRRSRARKIAGEDMVQKNTDLAGFYGSGSSSQAGELPADVPQTLNPQELDGTPAAAWKTSKLNSPFSSPDERGVQERPSISGGLRAGASQTSPSVSSFVGGGMLEERDMTAAELAQLEDEERRIDDAIRESERLVELRAQREAVQNRIRMARGNTAGNS